MRYSFMNHQALNNSSLLASEDMPKESQNLRLPTNLDPLEPEKLTAAPLIQEELVIEEVSIDGMCGVY
jgi:mycofactocin precursor